MTDEQQKAALYEQLREVIRRIITKIEDQTIENSVYALVIEQNGMISAEQLKGKVATALLEPAAREGHSGLWKALETIGEQAYFEALLRDLPKTDRPN
ncbi:hypothetical protein [Acidicapsa acidisoli]|uniref:hypothetical protein n=1 Tax=Acidicapsa acidisoli TaxID=1615681 RepID=UPI0021E01AB4|nr:hypothetical protein [Acidicapsa acidisoli]